MEDLLEHLKLEQNVLQLRLSKISELINLYNGSDTSKKSKKDLNRIKPIKRTQKKDSYKDKVLNCLKTIQRGKPDDVANELLKIEPLLGFVKAKRKCADILSILFRDGIIGADVGKTKWEGNVYFIKN